MAKGEQVEVLEEAELKGIRIGKKKRMKKNNETGFESDAKRANTEVQTTKAQGGGGSVLVLDLHLISLLVPPPSNNRNMNRNGGNSLDLNWACEHSAR
ncbi:hypothetical protein PIB30_017327 [Stylosanthes scabra]|uniref:Uncharacterized protein n=1 Tax=Stylosanthes scabra TaxID=79078 RepID=A0ABU6S7S2_9FABA|nr:hypothetical protein [Stylosanthes scabra]